MLLSGLFTAGSLGGVLSFCGCFRCSDVCLSSTPTTARLTAMPAPTPECPDTNVIANPFDLFVV